MQNIFTVEEAEAALLLDWRPQTFDEIAKKASAAGFPEAWLRDLIDSMERKGSIFASGPVKKHRYSLQPILVGMYEMQLPRLTAGLALDLRKYMREKFAMEYYTTEVRQIRVIPVHQSVTPPLVIAAYDDIREIVDQSNGRIGISDCICRAAKDLIGRPCLKTDRREVCINFGDWNEQFVRNGWGRYISKSEAFKIIGQNEKEGLMLMSSSMQDPHSVCACCTCCCGINEMVGMMPRPVDFVESNYRAELTPGICTACGRCEKRCPMSAMHCEEKKAVAVDEKRCVGCGLCVSTCKSGSLKLVKKEKEFIPPQDYFAMMELIDKHKKSLPGKAAMMLKAFMGFKV